MATVDKKHADILVENNGRWPGHNDEEDGPETPAILIVEYTNAWGALAYGVTFYGEDPLKYLVPSEYVQNPRVYWHSPETGWVLKLTP